MEAFGLEFTVGLGVDVASGILSFLLQLSLYLQLIFGCLPTHVALCVTA